VSYVVASDWGSGYCLDATVSTTATTPVVGQSADSLARSPRLERLLRRRYGARGVLEPDRRQGQSDHVRTVSDPHCVGHAHGHRPHHGSHPRRRPPHTEYHSLPTATPQTAPRLPRPARPLPVGGVTAALTVASDWGSGYCADVRVSTTSTAPITWNTSPSGTAACSRSGVPSGHRLRWPARRQ
jgi:cellulase/cellobiase CelA1